MFDLYIKKKNDFDKEIINFFDNENDFNQVLNYSIEDGKRLRPLILLETYNMISDGKEYDIAMKFAIALEFIHNYSLIHDDLPSMDNDNYRRGRMTTHFKYGEDYAILAGDALLNQAYEILFDIIGKYPKNNIISAAKYLSNASGLKGMINGQVIDINDTIDNAQDIVTMYKNKTCRLIMAATTIAGYLAGLDNKDLKELENLGFCVGMAFQIQDDLIDIEKDNETKKMTYISYFGKEKSLQDMLEYTEKALKILEKYNKNIFLVELIKKLIVRKH